MDPNKPDKHFTKKEKTQFNHDQPRIWPKNASMVKSVKQWERKSEIVGEEKK